MKKSIAFLGALLFGSVTFAQVNKNDTINKTGSRKVSADDLKQFPTETETTEVGIIKIKGERGIKGESQKSEFLKISPDNAAKIKGSVTQKGSSDASAGSTFEKQHYTVKLTNANKKSELDATEQKENTENEAAIQKKHVANIKWTAGKVAKDSTDQKTKALNPYLKIKGQKKE